METNGHAAPAVLPPRGAFPPKQEISATPGNYLAIEAVRAAQEVKAAVELAREYPRNVAQCRNQILDACKSPSVALKAEYNYPQGGENVRGPSIRLAEVIAQCWGNLQFGVRELSKSDGVSEMEAYAWDLEKNVRVSKVFKAEHIRHTRSKGLVGLTTPREIYESNANFGARRLRACILEVVPKYVVDEALAECKITLKSDKTPIQDRIIHMLQAFGKLGVNQEMIEKRLEHSVELTTEDELLDLQAVHSSLEDGITSREEVFGLPPAPGAEKAATLKQKMVEAKRHQAAAAPAREPAKAETTAQPPTQVKTEPAPQLTAQPGMQAKPARTKKMVIDQIFSVQKRLFISAAELNQRCLKEKNKTADKMTKEDLEDLLNTLTKEADAREAK